MVWYRVYEISYRDPRPADEGGNGRRKMRYIGLTTSTLKKRLSNHLSAYRKFLRDGVGRCTSYDIFDIAYLCNEPEKIRIICLAEFETNDKLTACRLEGNMTANAKNNNKYVVNTRREFGLSRKNLTDAEYMYQYRRLQNL